MKVPIARELPIPRRAVLSAGAAALGGAAAASFARAVAAEPGAQAAPEPPRPESPFPVSLNTSTLRGHKLPIAKIAEIASRAGYAGIEPWPDELDRHVESGGKLEDLGKLFRDRGLAVTGAIAFFSWLSDDETERARGLEEARRRMDALARIGGTKIAAPPAGNVAGVSLLRAAERYRELIELGEKFGVIPALELWGRAPILSRLGECAFVALESGHPKACILPDVFHIYRGGSPLGGVALLSPRILGGFHLNDYPADPPREKARDSDRVYPGDGIAPLAQLFRDLVAIGYRGPVSVELFNPAYYAQDPEVVARTALEKTRAVLRQSLSG